MSSLQSPETLCFRLGMRPLRHQKAMMRALAQGDPVVNAVDNEVENMYAGVAVCALWSLLAYQGSRVLVVADDMSKASVMMAFLKDMTLKNDPAIGSIVKWPRWSLMKLGTDAAAECRVVTSAAPEARVKRQNDCLLIVLGASCSKTAFGDTLRSVQASLDPETTQTICLW